MTDQKPAKRVRQPRKPRVQRTAPKPEAVVLRFVGDGSVFQSGIPNRDVVVADNLSDELAELAVATGTHERA